MALRAPPQFGGIIQAAGQDHLPLGLLFGLTFVVAGLAFKVSAVPFHMWTPDVYEGAPTPITAFFATAPKLAAMGLFARVLFDAFRWCDRRLATDNRSCFPSCRCSSVPLPQLASAISSA